MTARLGQLRSLQKSVIAGDKPGSGTKSAAKDLERYIGKGSSSNASTIGKVIARGEAALSDLKSTSKSFLIDRSMAPGSGENRFVGSQAAFGPNPTARVLFHEASHSSSYGSALGIVRDIAVGSTNSAYGQGTAITLGRYGPGTSLGSANSLTYAFGGRQVGDEE